MFAEDAANVLGAARLFEAMLRTYDAPEERAKEIREAEHRGDELSHEIGRRLESTFVTPFDREDIHALISALDDANSRARASEAGATAYYTKPFSPIALLKEIERLKHQGGHA